MKEEKQPSWLCCCNLLTSACCPAPDSACCPDSVYCPAPASCSCPAHSHTSITHIVLLMYYLLCRNQCNWLCTNTPVLKYMTPHGFAPLVSCSPPALVKLCAVKEVQRNDKRKLIQSLRPFCCPSSAIPSLPFSQILLSFLFLPFFLLIFPNIPFILGFSSAFLSLKSYSVPKCTILQILYARHHYIMYNSLYRTKTSKYRKRHKQHDNPYFAI